MLSREATKVLQYLDKQEKKFVKNKKERAKVNYYELKENIFNKNSNIKVNMLLKFLLEERYIYNHLEGRENELTINDIENGNSYLVIGEKGYNYLKKRYFILTAQILPLLISIGGFVISIISLKN